METTPSKQGWHVANWGTWGWAETAVKGIGIAIGIVALFIALDGGDGLNTDDISGITNVVALIIAVLLTLLLAGAIVLRYGQREVVSFVFAIFNVIGHAGIAFYLLQGVDNLAYPIMFGSAFIAGDAVKHYFLQTTGYVESGRNTQQMLTFVRTVIAIYALFVVLILI